MQQKLVKPASNFGFDNYYLSQKVNVRWTSPWLEQLRQHSFENLSEAVWKTCDYTLHYLLEHHQLVHPRAIATRNWFLQTTRRRHAAGSVRPTSA